MKLHLLFALSVFIGSFASLCCAFLSVSTTVTRPVHTSILLAITSQPHVPNFCADCGADSMELRIPDGDERLRAVCNACGRIEYSNPKVVVACVVFTTNKNEHQKCLLAKRAIEPRKGTWGIPQGFMEHGETTREAAAREVLEETGVVVEKLQLRAVYNVPGSVQIVYEARVLEEKVQERMQSSTAESLEVALFPFNEIPYEELCFPTVQWALDHCLGLQEDGLFPKIQQRTKFFDEELEKWMDFEDEGSS